ncbi:MAG TPA: hypothetical protein VIY86_06560 [Pirellulaceae bacterium]
MMLPQGGTWGAIRDGQAWAGIDRNGAGQPGTLPGGQLPVLSIEVGHCVGRLGDL